MEYKVIPLVSSINARKENSTLVEDQLQKTINHYAGQGWKFIRIESLSTFIQPDFGCFGIGAKPGHQTFRQIIIFSK